MLSAGSAALNRSPGGWAHSSKPTAAACSSQAHGQTDGHMPDSFTDAAPHKKVKVAPYSTAECRVAELIPVLGSQPVGDVSHKPTGTLPLLSARPAVTLATLKRAATNFAAR